MRPAAVRQNRLLLEPQTLWRFRRNEVLVLVQALVPVTVGEFGRPDLLVPAGSSDSIFGDSFF